MSNRWTWAFDETPPGDGAQLRARLGGKGQSLSTMTRAGFRVPPGFTITTEACRYVLAHDGAWPAGLREEVDTRMRELEAKTGRTFGAGDLRVSVRSGAAQSMPGMMDTLLNVGLCAPSSESDPEFAPYRDLVEAFLASTVGLDTPAATDADAPSGANPSATLDVWKRAWSRHTGRPFPESPEAFLHEAIDAVFRSWHAERARVYRRRNGLDDEAGTAVNVQVMFPSVVSGVVFTRDPNDPEADILLIEAARGLGEAVVSGRVTPDVYRVPRDAPSTYECTPGECADQSDDASSQHDASAQNDGSVQRDGSVKRDGSTGHGAAGGDAAPTQEDGKSAGLLTQAEVEALAALSLRVETWGGAAMDIEWGMAEGELALLQCRPIRGLDILLDQEKARRDAIDHLAAEARDAPGGRKVWVQHNLGETLPAPTPLTWDVVRDFMRGDGGFGRMYQELGYLPSERVRAEGFLSLIAGRIYADTDRQAELFWGTMPLAYDPDAILADPSLLDGPPTTLDPERATPAFLASLPGTLLAMIRCWRTMRRTARTVASDFETHILPPWLAYIQSERARDLSALPPDALLDLLDTRTKRVLHEFAPASLKPGFFGGLALSRLRGRLATLLPDTEAEDWTRRLTTGLEGDCTAEQDAMLAEVAAGAVPLTAFLDRFGHRCIGEMELARPRWHEDPDSLAPLLKQAARQGNGAAATRHREAHARSQAAREELPQQLRAWGGSVWREEIEADIEAARTLLPYRENGKFYLMMGYDLIRACLCELARRWNLGPEIFYLQRAELSGYPSHSAELDKAIAARRLRWTSAQRLEMPPVIDSRTLDTLGLPAPVTNASDGDARDGVALSAGTATGTVAVVHDPAEADNLPDDFILVCTSTDPGWAPLFSGARGLVVERGGALSHGAIVARDFGIPAVACPGAIQWLRTGERIHLDGRKGRITRLDAEAAHGDA